MTIEWLRDTHHIHRLVEIFTQTVSTDYITSTEIREGRAVSTTEWSTALSDLLHEELRSRVSVWQVAVIRPEGVDAPIEGWAMVCPRDADTVVLEDIVVTRAGLGIHLLEWITEQVRNRGYRELVGEVGVRNTSAQEFLARRGWVEESRIFRKALTVTKSK